MTAGTFDLDPWSFPVTDVQFEVDEKAAPLGSGTYGVVFRACWRGEVCAAKTLKAFLYPMMHGLYNSRDVENVIKGAHRELKVLARMDHPCVLSLLGVAYGTLEGVQIPKWILTPLMKESLHSFLHPASGTAKLVEKLEAAQLAADICSGVAYLHGEGVAHRDIKTRNVFLSAEGRAKLGDMGAARMVETLSQSTVAGTLSYMAPEAMIPGSDAYCSDVYSVGVTLLALCLSEEPARNVGVPETFGPWEDQKARASLAHPQLARLIAGCCDVAASRPTAQVLCSATCGLLQRLSTGAPEPDDAQQVVELTGGDRPPPPSALPSGAVAPAPLMRDMMRGTPRLLVDLGRLTWAWDCRATADGLFVTCGNGESAGVSLFCDDGAPLRRIGAGAFGGAVAGIALADDDVFVSDSGAQSVAVLSRAGGARVRTIGTNGNGAGQLRDPQGLAVLDGRLFVANHGHDRVTVFLADGTFVTDSGRRSLGRPVGLRCDGDRVLVADRGNKCVRVLRVSDLSCERCIGEGLLGAVRRVAVYRGLLLVSEKAKKLVTVFDVADGRLVASLAGFGKGEPLGMDVLADGMLFVTTSEHRVYRVQLE